MKNNNGNDKLIKIQGSDYKDGVLYRRCPCCQIEKPIEEFGLRQMVENGLVRNQPWCKKCRSKK